jgi:mannose-6-phosphate isomerase-like protein (cupin superfamily)
MKLLPLVALFAAIATPGLAQERAPAAPKVYASAAEVEQAIARARAAHKGDNTNTVEVLATVGTYPVQLEYRTGATAPSVHVAQAELIYVVEGGATFVMGGTMENARPNGGNMTGTAITGGTARQVSKGDYILVPAGMPHWVSAVQGGVFISTTLHMPMTAQ